MSQVEKFAPGSFCWTDLGTTDVASAKKFYGELLGWSFEEVPSGTSTPYTMCKVRGMEVCAMHSQTADMKMRPRWATYVSVEDADASAKKSAELGGKVIVAAFDVTDAGRMAVVADPNGAVIALWQAKKHKGAKLVGEAQAMCWNELTTRDTDAATEFYGNLFGWTAKVGTDPMQYIHLQQGEKSIGGMMKTPKDMANVPPYWLVYFAVGDVAATTTKAKAMGGSVIVSPMDIPSTGTFSVLSDPQGAVFAIFKPTLTN